MDMVSSDEVYIQEPPGWVRVIPSVENTMLSSPQIKPESIKISFTLAEEYDNQTPDIKDLTDFMRPRVFSEQHSDQFN